VDNIKIYSKVLLKRADITKLFEIYYSRALTILKDILKYCRRAWIILKCIVKDYRRA
jgi:hypothetical protein